MSAFRQTCHRCGTDLGSAASGGMCLACLLSLGLKTPDDFPDDALEAGSSDPALAADVFDRFRLLGKIGEGGCGVVYRAEQLQPVRREVALKVIKLGMDTASVIARFEAERQALALMDHPGIAKVFDAGSSRSGRPFFAMELVAGERITDFCDRKALSVAQRLELFALVCEAVQHAHQKGIIHRDLKPSNLLVTEHDGVAQPKVIDFGIAKATSRQRLADQTIYTAFDQFVGTPAYMSPEQAGATGEDVDTRSDIYSLGVLLYELLTGRPPFEPERLRQAAVDEIFRIIRHEDPARPSARLTTLSALEFSEVSRCRFAAPPKLLREVRGDLDWVVMKALEKLPAHRYETANALAVEVRRHLQHEPVQARPPSAGYRFQKMVRRNTLAVIASVAVLLALLAGLVVSTWRFFKEQEARQHAVAAERTARAEAARANQVATLLKEMLAGVGPSVALGRDTKMLRGILDLTAERVGRELKDHPDIEAELRATIGKAYDDLGELDKAAQMHREALRLREQCFGATNAAVAESLNQLVAVLNRRTGQSDVGEAETLARRSVALQKARWGEEHEEVAQSLEILAWSLAAQRKHGEAEAHHRQVLALRRKLYGPGDERLIPTLTALAATLSTMPQKLGEAESLARESLALQEKKVGIDHPSLADGCHALSMVLQSQSKSAEAETAIRRALALRRKYFGEEYSLLPTLLSHLAITLSAQGKLAEAETTIRDAIAHQGKFLGEDHPHIPAYFLGVLVTILKEQKKWTEAETTLAEWVPWCRRLGGPPNLLMDALHLHSIVVVAQGKWPEAEPVLRELAGLCDQIVSTSSATRWSAVSCAHQRRTLGEALLRQQKFAEAETLLLGSYEILKDAPGKWDLYNLEECLKNLVQLYEAIARLTEAAEWRQKLAVIQERKTQKK